ncbi:Uncharacterised protein [Bordetella pertussis]|nr:Uncharacterised protein [Bordetella pertussis]CPJ05949.1 Uncharacterised protein [Bordetella pertussis]CPJ45318.1 Uncharacterised protein [Bordetella pertussis]CPK22477.1 Uncharacterised protein [Bordetella pertussis]CPO80841.1 Uncharacterised protein [Bordetella pertussis]
MSWTGEPAGTSASMGTPTSGATAANCAGLYGRLASRTQLIEYVLVTRPMV